ncbi:MAG: PhzF family phenazine biosynthesis protein [Solirubrobacterales bacterium]
MNGLSDRPVFWLDVFTDTPMLGNPLAVVLDADGVSDETMLSFAREVNLSETTFVQTATTDGGDYRNRIWTISGEIPFAGHPSLGTAVAVAISRGIESTTFTQQTQVGLQEIEVQLRDGGWHAAVHQPAAEFGESFAADRLAPSLGLAPSSMDPYLSAQIVSTGLPALLVPVASSEALAEARPVFDEIRQIDGRDALNTYVFFHERGSRTIKARCFGEDLAGIEDPATGSAAGPLVAYLQDCLDISEVVIEQGVEMGRASRLEAKMVDGRPMVGGDVVVLSVGHVNLP